MGWIADIMNIAMIIGGSELQANWQKSLQDNRCPWFSRSKFNKNGALPFYKISQVKYNCEIKRGIKRGIMKVIFLEDVPSVAKVGDIKEVADGYGRNFLLPRKLALLAEPQVVKSFAEQLKVKALSQAQTEAELVELANQLNGKEIVLEAKAGSKDRLYGSITAADIAAELEKTTGLSIDKRKIELGELIHQVGNYEVAIRLAKDIVPKIKVTVSGKAA